MTGAIDSYAFPASGGLVGIAVSYGLVWLISPLPFPTEPLDVALRSTEIQLVLTRRSWASVRRP